MNWGQFAGKIFSEKALNDESSYDVNLQATEQLFREFKKKK